MYCMYIALLEWFQVDQEIESRTRLLSPNVPFPFSLPEYGTLTVELVWGYSRDTVTLYGTLHVDCICEAKYPHFWYHVCFVGVVLWCTWDILWFIRYSRVGSNWRQYSLSLWPSSSYCSAPWVDMRFSVLGFSVIFSIPGQICLSQLSILPYSPLAHVTIFITPWYMGGSC